MRRRALLLMALAILLGAGAVAVATRVAVGAERPYDVAFVPRAQTMRWVSLGHPTLAANLFWLRAVQYMGEPQADARGWQKLFPLVDLVTDLDPRHGYAYQVSGNVLASAGRIEESNAILEKGTRNVPNRYILPFHRAVNAFLYQGNYAEAGRWFERAAATPGAPTHLREYVTAMYVKGNRADAAIGFLSHLLDEARDDESRKALRKQLDQARLERDALALEAAIARYTGRFFVRPIVPEQLVSAGLVTAIPPDPYGGRYIIDPEGRVRSSANPTRFGRPLAAAERRELAGAVQRMFKTVKEGR